MNSLQYTYSVHASSSQLLNVSSRLKLTCSPGEIGLNLELIGVKLENILCEAEFIPYQHIKSPQKSGSGKKFYRQKSKMAAKTCQKPLYLSMGQVLQLKNSVTNVSNITKQCLRE